MTTGFKNLCESLGSTAVSRYTRQFCSLYRIAKDEIFKSCLQFCMNSGTFFWPISQKTLRKCQCIQREVVRNPRNFFSLSKFRIHQVCSFGSMQKIKLCTDFNFYSVLEHKQCNTSTDPRYKCFPVYQAILYFKFRFLTIRNNIQFKFQTEM